MSFPPGTEMFQFPGFALKTLCVQVPSTCPTRLETARQSTVGCQVGCPIRRSTDQGLFSAPHGLSQSTTSFIASCRLGIHQTPLLRLIRSRRRRTVRSPHAAAPFCIGPPRQGSSPPPGSSATGAPPRQTGRPASVSVILTWERRPSASARTRCPRGKPPTAMRRNRKVSSVSLSSRCQSPGFRAEPAKGQTNLCLDPRGGGGGCGRTRTSDLTLIRRTL